MKKNLLYILLFAMSLTSCGDFLELYPKTQLNDGDFYKTEDDVKMGLYGLMNTLQHSVDNIYSTFIYMSDEGDTGGGPGEGGYGLSSTPTTVPTGGVVNGTWECTKVSPAPTFC